MSVPASLATDESQPVLAAGPVGRPRRRGLRRLSRRDVVVLSLMVGIPTLIEAVLIWLPTLLSTWLSFTRWDGIGGFSDAQWTGGGNYQFIASAYPPFWPAVWHNLLWLLFLGVIATPLGLMLAVLLDRNLKGSRFYQSIFFIPVMLSLALVGVIWALIYNRGTGLVNGILGTSGTAHAIDWFGNPSVNIWAAMVAASWKHVGYIMILYLAGLKGIDPGLREAAALDGANAWQSFWHVVFPTMRPINIIVVVITVIESLRAFDIVWVINGGRNGLELLNVLIVRNLVGEGTDVGVGSAIAVVLLVISLVPIVIYLSKVFRPERRA